MMIEEGTLTIVWWLVLEVDLSGCPLAASCQTLYSYGLEWETVF